MFVAVFLGYKQYGLGGFMVFVVLCLGAPGGSISSGSGFKAFQKTMPQHKVSLTDREMLGIEPATPGLQGIGLSPTSQARCALSLRR